LLHHQTLKRSFIILIPAGLDCIIAGWGLIDATNIIIPDKLQYLQVKTRALDKCKRERRKSFQVFQICAGVEVKNKSACMVIKMF
jgi:Trypsin